MFWKIARGIIDLLIASWINYWLIDWFEKNVSFRLAFEAIRSSSQNQLCEQMGDSWIHWNGDLSSLSLDVPSYTKDIFSMECVIVNFILRCLGFRKSQNLLNSSIPCCQIYATSSTKCFHSNGLEHGHESAHNNWWAFWARARLQKKNQEIPNFFL